VTVDECARRTNVHIVVSLVTLKNFRRNVEIATAVGACLHLSADLILVDLKIGEIDAFRRSKAFLEGGCDGKPVR